MNEVLRAFIEKFVVVYFDDTLIYSKSLHEHMDHLRAIFNALRAARLFGNIEKCTFCTDRVFFLGYVVTPKGIEVDEAKVQAIRALAYIRRSHKCEAFMDLLDFTVAFTIAAPLNDLTKKGVAFHWGKPQEDAFNLLKDKLTHAPLLQLLDFGKTFELGCNASGVGISGVLMQENKSVTYFSEKLSCPVLNYSTYDKELYALEAYGGGLMGHFGAKKMEAVLSAYFFWPKMRRDVESERVYHDAKERADFILKLHKTTGDNIEKMNERYRDAGNKGRKKINLEPGDLVWLHLRKDRFPDLRKSKLMPRADGLFKKIEKINNDAYKLELSSEFGVSSTFNIADLKPYLGEEDKLESRVTPLQEGEDDEDISPMLTNDIPSVVMHGPLERARARQLNQQERNMKAMRTSKGEEESKGDVQVKLEAQFISED
ncbi:hypothetical protein U9M48_040516 [Paspalum notatum var. saurae]|uniref:Reverse transcriptase domain-containing protein n=1 Tax=Paspalum notatum var. saurae TaxID=547442 RepID=A0AAQ3ULW5_PASNO